MLDREVIVAATDLPALADALLGPRRGGGSSTWPCPGGAHDPSSSFRPGITVFSTGRGEQRWACQSCSADGSAIDLVMATQRLGYRDALEFLQRRTGPAIARPAPEQEPRLGVS